jgi:hypothetical protein
MAAALEYQQSKLTKLDKEGGTLEARLGRNYEALGKTLERLDKELAKAEDYLAKCTMIRSELGLVHDRIELAKR